MDNSLIHQYVEAQSPVPRGPHRWESVCPLPQVPEFLVLGYDNTRNALPLQSHHHGDAFEFVFVVSGVTSWEVGGERYETRAGDIFCTRPKELHRGFFDAIEPSCFWWLILLSPLTEHGRPDKTWLGLNREDYTPLIGQLLMATRVRSVGTAAGESLKLLRSVLESQGTLSVLRCRLAILNFLTAILGEDFAYALPADLMIRLNYVVQMLTYQMHTRFTIQDLAKMAGVSSSYFCKAFRTYTGISPIAYAEMIRIREACRLLEETPQSITDIAYDLGYTSSQHFATVFRRCTSHTPSEWRATKTSRHGL